MLSITRSFQFCAGHRLYDHKGLCESLHGHNYKLEVTVISSKGELDSVGRILDFSSIKKVVGTWLDTFWDHALLVYQEDPMLAILPSIPMDHGKLRVYKLPYNPTAENMLQHLMDDIMPGLLEGLEVSCSRLKIWETDNSAAELESRPRISAGPRLTPRR